MPSSEESDQDPNNDRYELFVQRFTKHEPDIRRFIRSLLPSWSDTDEVLQRTALVIWRKFDNYDETTNFMKWVCVIARFEALAFRRKMARDRLVFREDIMDLMAEEGAEEVDIRRAQHEALEYCMHLLPEKQRKFMLLAYTPGIKVKQMAKDAGSSAAAFYMRLKRLRRKLMECMETRIQQSTQA